MYVLRSTHMVILALQPGIRSALVAGNCGGLYLFVSTFARKDISAPHRKNQKLHHGALNCICHLVS